MAQAPPTQRYGLWRDSAGAVAIEYDRHVMEAVRAAASHGMHGIGRGGIEVGGVLLGTRLGDFFRILDWRQIPCGHSRGPSFLLSEEEMASLSSLMDELHRETDIRELQIVGWFVSHTRSTLELTVDELEIHSRFFDKPWQLVLTLQPSRFGDVECRVYRRSPEHLNQIERMEPLLGIAPLPVEVKPKTRVTRGGAGEALGPIEVHSGRRISRLWPVIAVAILAILATASIVVGLVPGFTERVSTLLFPRKLEPYDSFSLRASMRSDTLAEILWNGEVVQARGANRATLQVKDGAKDTQRELSKGELFMGRLEYPVESNRVDISLALYDGQVLVGREAVRFRRPQK